MAGKPDIRVQGDTIFIDGVRPIKIQNMDKWKSMNLAERGEAIQEIYKAVKPKRVGRAALQGASLGLSDEGIAALTNPAAAVQAAISGETEGSKPYYQALESERQKLSQFQQQYPVQSAVSEFTGAAVPAIAATMFSGGTAAPATSSRLAQAFQSGKNVAKVGAIEGGLYGFGQAEGGLEDRMKGTVAGATLGAVFAPVAQAATYPLQITADALITSAKSLFGSKGGKAVQAELQKLAEATGDNADVIAQKVANGEIMAENETLRMTVRSLMSKGGIGETMVRGTFEPLNRPKITRDEAMAEIEAYLARDAQFANKNPKIIESEFDAQVKKAEGEAYKSIPSYKQPFARVGGVIEDAAQQFPKIADEMNTFITATSKAKNNPLIVKKEGEWVLSRLPTLEEGEAARRYFRDKADEMFQKKNPLGKNYSDVRNELEAVINEQSPTLVNVRANAATVRQARDAFNDGQTILNRSSDDVELMLRKIGDDEAALKALRAGTLANIRKKVEAAGGTNLMNKLANPEMKEGKIFRLIFPADAVDDTLAKISRAAKTQKSANEIISGPSTALVQEASKRTGANITAEDVSNLGNPITMLRVGMKVANSLSPDLNDKQREQVLRILLSDDPDIVYRALTDSRGLDALIKGIQTTSDALRSGVRRGVVQQTTTDDITGGIGRGLLGAVQ